ncbi:MAG: 50S ribosomal protein L10 [Terriglobia bacterium]
MKRDAKQQKAEQLRQDLLKARAVILSGFEGIKVSQDFELRRKLEDVQAHYRVVKNSIIERAAQSTPLEAVAKQLRGTTSLAYTDADPVALAKAMTAYAKENAALVFRTGIVEGRVIDLSELTSIAALPSREALLAKVLYLINSPAQRLASVVSAVARSLAVVVQQAVEHKKFKETPDA